MWHRRLTFHSYFQNALNQPTHFAVELQVGYVLSQ